MWGPADGLLGGRLCLSRYAHTEARMQQTEQVHLKAHQGEGGN
jgi:hypothetical protein